MHIPPRRYREMTIESWTPANASQDARQLVRAWLEHESRPWCLLLLGAVGTGKTHLATGAFRAWQEGGSAQWGSYGWWLSATEVAVRMRDEVRDGVDGGSIVEKLLAPRLVLIDDLGAGRMTPHVQEQWLYVLISRYNDVKPTIITSNAEDVSEFDEIDPRLTSRLRAGLIVTLAGRDHRDPRPATTAQEAR